MHPGRGSDTGAGGRSGKGEETTWSEPHASLVATGFCSAYFCITEIVLEAQESGRTGGGNGGLICVAPLGITSKSPRDDCFMLPRSTARMLMKNLKKQMSTVCSFGMSN